MKERISGYYVSSIPKEKAYLVGLHVRGSEPLLSVQESLDELEMLAETAGMVVVGHTQQSVQQINSTTFIGSGKVQEIIEAIDSLEANAVIFDDELSPRHQRELEKRFGEKIKVIDRSALILDIFAQHARTREGALQVELAQYEYRLPRLTRQWTHLARQAGGGGSRSGNAGVGLRGPGETQLEVDKREIRRKITKLKEDIEQVRRHRGRHRQQRVKNNVPVVALVGYTNAGKSTLFRALTGADVYVANQLFATLDPTTRKLELPSGQHAVMTDTVGFIQKLPTTLIAAFRATLEEIAHADVILHVVDLSHPNAYEHYESVEDTLAQLEVPHIPKILVANKSDKLEQMDIDELLADFSLHEDYQRMISISALKGENLDNLSQTIEDALVNSTRYSTLLIPHHRGDIISALHQLGTVRHQDYIEDGTKIEVQLPSDVREKYRDFLVEDKSDA